MQKLQWHHPKFSTQSLQMLYIIIVRLIDFTLQIEYMMIRYRNITWSSWIMWVYLGVALNGGTSISHPF